MNLKNLLVSALLLHLSVSAVQAQVQGAPCTYRTCALRIEPRGLGSALVQGSEGEVVARVGMGGTRPSLDTILARSDSAVVYARQFERLAPRGALATGAASLLLIVPAFTGQVGPEVVAGASIGAIALTVYGTVALLHAQRALSRGIWWYNESLVP